MGALASVVSVISVSTALGGPPGTMSYTEQGRANAQTSQAVDVQAGKNIVVQTVVLEPNARALWHKNPGPAWVLIKRGTVTTYRGCGADKELWKAGKAYYHHYGEHDTYVHVNEGTEPVELVSIFFNVPPEHPAGLLVGDPQAPPAECLHH
jgi:quercetin dioxygenase-like cupin family protein